MEQREERRKSVRIFLPGKQVRIVSGPYMALVGKVFDISAGGVRFSSESELGKCEFIELEIVMPDGFKMRSECRIVHVEKDAEHHAHFLYGVEFLTIDERSRIALARYIDDIRALRETANGDAQQ